MDLKEYERRNEREERMSVYEGKARTERTCTFLSSTISTDYKNTNLVSIPRDSPSSTNLFFAREFKPGGFALRTPQAGSQCRCIVYIR